VHEYCVERIAYRVFASPTVHDYCAQRIAYRVFASLTVHDYCAQRIAYRVFASLDYCAQRTTTCLLHNLLAVSFVHA